MTEINFTEAALKRIKDTLEAKQDPELALRLYIIGGGCAGFQYGFGLDKNFDSEQDCLLLENPRAVINYLSLQYLAGSTVDFVTDITGSRFKIENPNAEATCSCGASFNLKEA